MSSRSVDPWGREDPDGLMDLAGSRAELVAGWVDWAERQGFQPQSFITPTFDEQKVGRVSPERALSAWRWLVRRVGLAMYGQNFRDWCKHAPFSYLVGVDYSKLGAVHLHAVVHGWIDYRLAIFWWSQRFGRIDLHPVDQGNAEEVRVALAHVTKYALKGSNLMSWWFRSGDPDLAREHAVRSRRQQPPASWPAARSAGTRQAQLELPGMGASAQHLAARADPAAMRA